MTTILSSRCRRLALHVGVVLAAFFGLIGSTACSQVAAEASVRPAVQGNSSAEIGDLVWRDINGNGVQDDGAQAGLEGVILHLYLDDGDSLFDADRDALMGAQTTTPDGAYSFLAWLEGSYWVEVAEDTLPLGLTGLAGPDSREHPAFLTVSLGSAYPGIDFGYSARGSIWGIVYYDHDLDGAQGLIEAGIPQVRVCLHRDGDSDGQLSDADELLTCAFTDDQGNYLFGSLLYGDYLVVQPPLPEAGFSTPHVRTVFLDPWRVAAVEVEAIGNVLFASASGSIFTDSNSDGRYDPATEMGLPRVTVTATELASGAVQSRDSSETGSYRFDSLLPATYRIETFNRYPGLILMTARAFTLTLGFGQQVEGIDFGYLVPTGGQIQGLNVTVEGSGNHLHWWTTAEAEISSFVVWRALREDGPYVAVSGPIQVLAGPNGAEYNWTDPSAIENVVYWYELHCEPEGGIFGPVTAVLAYRAFSPRVLRSLK